MELQCWLYSSFWLIVYVTDAKEKGIFLLFYLFNNQEIQMQMHQIQTTQNKRGEIATQSLTEVWSVGSDLVLTTPPETTEEWSTCCTSH